MRILLVTDTHLAEDDEDALANWESVRAFAENAKPDLTLHLGDITRDAWSAPEELDFASALAAEWPTPIRFLPGNHDIGDNPPGPGVDFRQPLSLDHLARYREMFGPDYWTAEVSVKGEDWLLVGLNPQLFATGTEDEEEHWAWLAETLDAARGRPVAVFSHKPLFQERFDEEPPHIRYVPTAPRRRLIEMLGGVDCRAFLSGHTHQYRETMQDGTRHIWVPSSAYRFSDAMQQKIGEKIVGIGMLELGGPGGLSFDVLCPEGLAQNERTIVRD